MKEADITGTKKRFGVDSFNYKLQTVLFK